MAEVINIATFNFDLDRLNKSIDDYQKRLFELQKEQKRYADQNKGLESQMKNLVEAQKLLISAGQKESQSYKDVEAQIKSVNAQQEQLYKNQRNLQIETGKVRAEYTRATKAQQAMRNSMGELLSSTEAYEQALKREVKTKEDAKKSTAELIKLGDQLDLTNEDNVKTLELLNKKIDENNEFVRQNSSAMQQQRMNIGNYQQDVKDALNELNLFNGGLAGFSSRATQAGGATALLGNSLKAVTSATVGMTKAALAFIATPIGAVIAVLAGAFLLVQNALKRSEDATNKLKVAFAPLTGIIKMVMKALEPLGEFLIDGLVAGLEMATTAFQGLLVGLEKAARFLGLDSMADSIGNFNESVAETIRGSKELAQAEIELEKAQRKARLTQLQYQKDAEKLRQTRDDESLSIKERIQANEELGKVLERQLQEELAIAQMALKVANLRMQYEGQTTELLDAQADALTTVADIEERINGQRSEQLRNQVSLQKQAHEQYMKQVEAQIQKQKEQLDLWIAQQGTRARTLQDQLELDRQIAEKSISILDAELKAKKISREKYNLEVLKIQQDLAQAEAELMVDNAKRELDLLIKNTDAQLEEKKRLSGEELLIIQEQENAKLAFEAERYAQGLISETEYQDAKLAIQDEFLKKERDLRNSFEEQQRADRELRDQLETEAKLLALEENAWNEFEAQQIILDEQYELEQIKLQQQYDEGKISYENFLQAQKNLTQDYANQEKEIAKLKEQYKLDVASQTFANLSSIAGAESAAGKAFAIAQTTIDTYQSATAAYKAMAGIPVIGPALGAVAAGAAVVSGLANVKKITSVKSPKSGGGGVTNPEIQGFAGGGVVQDGDPIYRPNGDNVMITARTGEAILNQSQRGFIGNDILNMAGVPGVIPSNNSAVQGSMDSNSSGLTEIIADAVYRGSLLGTSSGAESGFVQASENRVIQNNATF